MKKLVSVLSILFIIASPALAGPVDEMMEVDRAFAQMAMEDGIPAAFAAYASQEVRMFPDGGQPYAGRDALIERFSKWPDSANMKWAPEEGMAAPGGEFGFTWGRYLYTRKVDDGDDIIDHGKYVSIWRKENGAWKFVADIGNSNPAPEVAD